MDSQNKRFRIMDPNLYPYSGKSSGDYLIPLYPSRPRTTPNQIRSQSVLIRLSKKLCEASLIHSKMIGRNNWFYSNSPQMIPSTLVPAIPRFIWSTANILRVRHSTPSPATYLQRRILYFRLIIPLLKLGIVSVRPKLRTQISTLHISSSIISKATIGYY